VTKPLRAGDTHIRESPNGAWARARYAQPLAAGQKPASSGGGGTPNLRQRGTLTIRANGTGTNATVRFGADGTATGDTPAMRLRGRLAA